MRATSSGAWRHRRRRACSLRSCFRLLASLPGFVRLLAVDHSQAIIPMSRGAMRSGGGNVMRRRAAGDAAIPRLRRRSRPLERLGRAHQPGLPAAPAAGPLPAHSRQGNGGIYQPRQRGGARARRRRRAFQPRSPASSTRHGPDGDAARRRRRDDVAGRIQARRGRRARAGGRRSASCTTAARRSRSASSCSR